MQGTGTKDTRTRVPDSRQKAEYPYVEVLYTSRVGHQLIYNTTPDSAGYRVEGRGGYVERNDFDGRRTSLHIGAEHDANKGKTSTTLGSSDSVNTKHARNNNFGESYSANKGYAHSATDGVASIARGPTSGVVTQVSRHVDAVQHGSGDVSGWAGGDGHGAGQGDTVSAHTGNRISMVQGEQAQYQTGGNTSQVTDGSHKIYCKDFIVDAETITLSTRTGKITIKSADEIIVNADKDLKLFSGMFVITASDQGSKMEQGTTPATPVKFNPSGRPST